jgi:hypothetical protein
LLSGSFQTLNKPFHWYNESLSPAPQRWIGSPGHGRVQSASGAKLEPLAVRSSTSPQTTEGFSDDRSLGYFLTHNTVHRTKQQTRQHIDLQEIICPTSTPATGYPNAAHWSMHASAVLLPGQSIWLGSARPPSGSLSRIYLALVKAPTLCRDVLTDSSLCIATVQGGRRSLEPGRGAP